MTAQVTRAEDRCIVHGCVSYAMAGSEVCAGHKNLHRGDGGGMVSGKVYVFIAVWAFLVGVVAWVFLA